MFWSLEFSGSYREHCPISAATTHIGSSRTCSGSQSRFGLVLVDGLDQSKAVPVRHPKAIIQLAVSCCCHCDGEVVIDSTNGHLVLITHLLSLSKIRALNSYSVLHNALYRRC